VQSRPADTSSTGISTKDSGSGKSHLAVLLAERWFDAGDTLPVIDPEGDHSA
jgi:hypothetical protein